MQIVLVLRTIKDRNILILLTKTFQCYFSYIKSITKQDTLLVSKLKVKIPILKRVNKTTLHSKM